MVVASCANVPGLDEPPGDSMALATHLLYTHALLVELMFQNPEVGLLILTGFLQLLELQPQIEEPDHDILLFLQVLTEGHDGLFAAAHPRLGIDPQDERSRPSRPGPDPSCAFSSSPAGSSGGCLFTKAVWPPLPGPLRVLS